MEIKKEDVEYYLDEVRKAIRDGRYTVSPRGKNEQLFIDYDMHMKHYMCLAKVYGYYLVLKKKKRWCIYI